MKYNNHNLSEKQTNKFMLKSIGVFFDIYTNFFTLCWCNILICFETELTENFDVELFEIS